MRGVRAVSSLSKGRIVALLAAGSVVSSWTVPGDVSSVAAQVIPTQIAAVDAPFSNTTIGSVSIPSLNGVGGFLTRIRTGNVASSGFSDNSDFAWGTLAYSGSGTPTVYGTTFIAERTVSLQNSTSFGTNPISVPITGLFSGFQLTDSQTIGYTGVLGSFTPTSYAVVVGNRLIARSQTNFPSGLGYDNQYWGRDLALVGLAESGTAFVTATVNTAASLDVPTELGQVLLSRTAGPSGTWTRLLYNGQPLSNGDTISPESTATGTNPIGSIAVSRNGAFYTATVDVNPSVYNANTNPFPITLALLRNGANVVQLASGADFREGSYLGRADNGTGTERISQWGQVAINNSGTIALNLRIGPPRGGDTEETILVGQRLRYREGQYVDGGQLRGLVNSVELNNNGDLLWSYSTTVGVGNTSAALYLNDERIVTAGTLVDTNNDGVPDTQVSRFFEALGSNISDRDADGNVYVYFIAATEAASQNQQLFRTRVNLVGSRWTPTTGGTWSAGNFTAGDPNAVAARVSFTTPLSAGGGTVSLPGNRTVGAITFDSAQPYTLSGGSITIDNGPGTSPPGSGSTGILRVLSGSHTIASPLTVNSPYLSVRVDQAGSILAITQPVSTTGAVYKVGPGTAAVRRVTTPLLTVDDGTLTLTDPAAGGQTNQLIVTGSGLFNVGTSAFVVKGGDAQLTALRSAVLNWWASGARNGPGIGSLNATPGNFTTLALFSNRDPRTGGPFFSAYNSVGLDASDVILKYTWLGDTNLDGLLNGTDLGNIIEGLSTGGTGWLAGDVDNSGGVVSLGDLGLFLQAYSYARSLGGAAPNYGGGTALTFTASAAVPEPATAMLLAVTSTGLLARRRR